MYWIERVYPYIIAGCITIGTTVLKFDPLKSSNINEMIEGMVMLDSIIIGFIGAIIPVILSMKNESKLVKYVFEKDKDNLFRKYMSITIGIGLIDVTVSLLVYTKDIINQEWVLFGLRIMFIYFFVLFLLCTYRSMTCMLKLLFSEDKKIELANKLEEEKSKELWEKRGE